MNAPPRPARAHALCLFAAAAAARSHRSRYAQRGCSASAAAPPSWRSTAPACLFLGSVPSDECAAAAGAGVCVALVRRGGGRTFASLALCATRLLGPGRCAAVAVINGTDAAPAMRPHGLRCDPRGRQASLVVCNTGASTLPDSHFSRRRRCPCREARRPRWRKILSPSLGRVDDPSPSVANSRSNTVSRVAMTLSKLIYIKTLR